MGDRLGIPGAVSFAFLHWAANTTSPSFSIPCVLLYPFNLIAASFLPFDFSVTSFCFRCDKRTAQPLRSFSSISPPGGDRQAFFGNYVGDVTLLDFKFNFKNSTTKQIPQVQFFWCWWLVKKLLAIEQINIQLFLVLFWYLETGQEIQSAQKIQWNTIKVRSKYVFIYLLFFLGMAFLFFL